MTGFLTPAARRAIAVALLVVSVLAVAAIPAAPYLLARAARSELASLDARAAELQARLPLRERLLAEARVLEESGDLDRVLMGASTPAVAAAQLQGELAVLAGSVGVTVTSVQFLEPVDEGGFTRVGLRLAIAGDVRSVRDLLHAVETRTPALVIDTLSLTAPEVIGDPMVEPRLTVTLELHGWRRTAPATEEAGAGATTPG